MNTRSFLDSEMEEELNINYNSGDNETQDHSHAKDSSSDEEDSTLSSDSSSGPPPRRLIDSLSSQDPDAVFGNFEDSQLSPESNKGGNIFATQKTASSTSGTQVQNDTTPPGSPVDLFTVSSDRTAGEWLSALVSPKKVTFATKRGADLELASSLCSQLAAQLNRTPLLLKQAKTQAEISRILGNIQNKCNALVASMSQVQPQDIYSLVAAQVAGGDSDSEYGADLTDMTDYVSFGKNRPAAPGDDEQAARILAHSRKPYTVMPIDGSQNSLRMYVGLSMGKNIARLCADAIVHERTKYAEVCITYTPETANAMELIKWGIASAMTPLPKKVTRKIVIYGVLYAPNKL